jgi:hypothetical protein
MTRTSAESAQPTEAAITSHPSLDRSRFVPGSVLDKRYRIVGLLGRGGMGEVFRADDMKLGQPVALKFLPEGLERDEQRLSRFLNEVRTARQVTHPNVCRVFDIDEVDGQHYLSMEYVDGEDLSSLLRRIGHLPKDKATQIARQLCAGVQAAHEQGILHRDLKPANVMIDGRGQVKVTDFGLASLEESIKDGEIRSGTPAYMAPEQLAGKEVTSRSDIYALGLVLYQLFTGKQAFEANTPAELAALHQDSMPTSPSSHVEGFDPAVERIILGCLEKEPRDRPVSALAVSAALPGGDPLAAALAAGETPSPEMVAAAGSTDAMHPGLALGLAVLAVVGWAGVQYWLGSFMVRSVLPLDKPPAALAADAREVIRELGYTEPLYADPVDSAIGFEPDYQITQWIGENDVAPERWSRLGIVSFWYRQRPSPLVPHSDAYDGMFQKATVEVDNPPADVPGEIVVGLDLEGRLTSFAASSKRISDIETDFGGYPTPDWSKLFALAELDMDRFAPVEPRYDPHVSADARVAWIGSLSEADRSETRIEAAANAGRVASFAILGKTEVLRLASDPEPSSIGSFELQPALYLVFLIPGVVFARRNLKKGRADRRGATRVAVFVLVAQCLSLALPSHRLWWDLSVAWMSVAASGVFWAVLVWLFYVALVPHVRRVWPSILIAWSRLVGRANVRLRDPQIGRAVLVGLVSGVTLGLFRPLWVHLRAFLPELTPEPLMGNWSLVLGQRYALADLLGTTAFALFVCIGMLFILVVGFSLFRSRLAAMILIGALTAAHHFLPLSPESTGAAIAGAAMYVLAEGAVRVLVIVRFGLLAFVVAIFLQGVTYRTATTSWTAWHGQPGLIMLVIVALLAAYGFWAATEGRPLFGDAMAKSGSKT